MRTCSGRASPTASRDASIRPLPRPASSTSHPAATSNSFPTDWFAASATLTSATPINRFFENRTLQARRRPGRQVHPARQLRARRYRSIPTSARSSRMSRRSLSTSASRSSFPRSGPFFLENSNYFTLPMNLVFTRRIAHPEFGLRLTGKVRAVGGGRSGQRRSRAGRVRAADAIRTAASAPPSPSPASAATFSHQSTIGAIFTDREFGGGYNRVGGVDANHQDRPELAGAGRSRHQFHAEPRRYLPRLDPATRSIAERAGRKFNLQSLYLDYSPGFVTETGFVNRVDIRQENVNASYYFRPEGKIPDLLGTDAAAVQHLGPPRHRARLLCVSPAFAWT